MKPLTKWAWIIGIVLAYVAIAMLDSRHSARSADKESNMVTVRILDKQGKLTGPVQMPRVQLSDEEWKKRLTPEQYKITRGAGTEAAFCGGLLKNKEPGVYVCVDCGLPLFKSDAKFESGTGWPSFFQPIAKENIQEVEDDSYGMVRTEIRCERCGAHLGHVFTDGPKPTGLRYCMNSEALKFYANPDLKNAGEDVPTTQPTTRPSK